MQQARCHFLARTGGSADEHATTGACNALQRSAHRVDRGRVAGEFAALAHSFAQARVFPAKALRFRGTFYQVEEALCLERLFDKVHRAAADCRNGRVDIAVPGEDDDRQLRLACLDRVEYLEPVHLAAVEPDVEQDEAWPLGIDRLKRRRTVGCGTAFIALVAQDACDQVANIALVVDYQDVECH